MEILPSRGIRGPDLAQTKAWWVGAKFLKFPKEKWLPEPGNTEIEVNEANVEVMKLKAPPSITRWLTSVSKTVSLPNIEAVVDCNRYSSKTKLLRVTARVMRFINDIRDYRLASEQLKAAEKLWVRSIQASSFKAEARCLFHINEKKTILVKQLGLFKDQENIIRCYGRINESSSSMSEKQPIHLLSKHPFTDLIILGHHMYKIVIIISERNIGLSGDGKQ